MKRLPQIVTLSALLLMTASAAQAQIPYGIHTGEPPPPRAYRVPPQPGPGYEWIEGYQYLEGGRYKWHDGYWSQPPYEGAYWVAPYYDDGQYFAGRWEGARGNVVHDHRWDRGDQRDDRRYDPSNGSYRDRESMNRRSQAQATVRAAYLSVFGREPDPASAGWVDNVFTNRLSQQQLENELRKSDEYRQKHPGRR